MKVSTSGAASVVPLAGGWKVTKRACDGTVMSQHHDRLPGRPGPDRDPADPGHRRRLGPRRPDRDITRACPVGLSAAEMKVSTSGAASVVPLAGGWKVTMTAIPLIQGTGDASALVGQTVTTTGIVTAVAGNGCRPRWPRSPGPARSGCRRRR
jgi:hypothetical protein